MILSQESLNITQIQLKLHQRSQQQEKLHVVDEKFLFMGFKNSIWKMRSKMHVISMAFIHLQIIIIIILNESSLFGW
jgi:hypothetical protein